jgi:hypothetical protein
LGGIFGGIGGYCGAVLSRTYGGWPGTLYIALAILIVMTVHLIVQYLFLELSPIPKDKKSSPLAWDSVAPLRIKTDSLMTDDSKE